MTPSKQMTDDYKARVDRLSVKALKLFLAAGADPQIAVLMSREFAVEIADAIIAREIPQEVRND